MKKIIRQLSEKEAYLWNLITKDDKKILNDKVKPDVIYKKTYETNKIKKNKSSYEFNETNIKSALIKTNKLKNINKIENKVFINKVDTRTELKIKRGLLRPTSKLDLHGYYKKDAFKELETFIIKSILREERCILVITGRKISNRGPEGVLRSELPRWLSNTKLASYILYYTYAHKKDGGDGATYILLKKKNKIGVFNEKS